VSIQESLKAIQHSFNANSFQLSPVSSLYAGFLRRTKPMSESESHNQKFTIQIYVDHGVVYEYEVDSPEKVREHASAIVETGYRHNDGSTFVHYPPHRIVKVKCDAPIPTHYEDRARGT
jgi:hypothetical protein